MNDLSVTTPSDVEVLITRSVAAPATNMTDGMTASYARLDNVLGSLC